MLRERLHRFRRDLKRDLRWRIWFVATLLGFAAAFGGHAVRSWKIRSWQSAIGTVVHVWAANSYRMPAGLTEDGRMLEPPYTQVFHRMAYRYEVDGTKYRGTGDGERAVAGMTVGIIYDPDEPRRSMLGEPRSAGASAIAAALLFAAGIWTAIAGRFSRTVPSRREESRRRSREIPFAEHP